MKQANYSDASKEKKQKRMSKRKLLNSCLVGFLSLIFIGGVCIFVILAMILQDASISPEDFNSNASTPLMDKNGEVFAEIGEENRENITYDQLPQTVIDAFLAIEDSRYFTHNGFDLPRFIKSAINNLANGNLSQGGSTLTMQMVDNVRKDMLALDEANASSLQKIEWKIQEIFLSMGVESEMSKEDIITKYLNKVNFGYTARGIQKGAEYYFGKDVSQLNLSESAFLAGVVNAPNLFNPYIGTQWNENSQKWIDFYQEYAVKRRDDTLYQMYNHGYISEEEYKLAKSTELAFQLQGERYFQNDTSSAFVKMVEEEALTKYGINIHTTPCVVYTTLDPEVQSLADRITNGESFAISGSSSLTIPSDPNYNFSFSVMDVTNGEINAIGPGRNFDPNAESPYNINQATNTRSPGSTIKPIMEYALSFDHLGYSTSHTFADIPIDAYGNGQVLRNADNKYRGDVLFKDAVAQSYNTMAVSTLNELINTWGTDNLQKYLMDIGFDENVANNLVPQYAIGGAGMIASPVQMAGAYAMFANQGQYIEPHTIQRIEFPDDPEKETITASYTPVQAISPQAAYLMSDILNYATSNNYFMKQIWPQAGYPVYGKTGTSGWDEAGAQYGFEASDIREEWMVNYTNRYVIATWTGHTTPGVITEELLYANIPGKINRVILDYLAQKETVSQISKPDGITTISHVKGKFPYASPTENMDSSMLITGMIKNEFAKLEVLEADDLETLEQFSTTVNDATSIKLTFTPYPDADKTKAPSNTKTYNVLGISFTGAAFYDPGFVFGNVVYKADIKVNGNTVQTITTDNPDATHTLQGVNPGESIQVCGYYGYSKDGKKSNEICLNVDVPQYDSLDRSAYDAAYQEAQYYLDTSKYSSSSVLNLKNVLSISNTLVINSPTQKIIDEQTKAILEAIEICKRSAL